MKVEHILLDNDGTMYKLRLEFKEEVIRCMVDYLAYKLKVSKKSVVNERYRLIKKYGIESTEFIFGKEYNISYNEFIRQTYLRVPIEDYGIKYDRKLRDILESIPVPKSILTNNPSEFAKKILESLGVTDLFEHIIGSKEINFQLKPQKKAFLNAFKITGYNPKKIMFVDDTLEYHFVARKLGMTTVLVDSEKRHSDKAEYTINNIYDLKKILVEK